MFSQKDKQQLKAKGISEKTALQHIEIFKRGIPYVNLQSAATISNGISRFSEEERNAFINLYEDKREKLDLLKFVPASGAATRMFKSLFEFLSGYEPERETINAYVNRTGDTSLITFIVGMEKFPFYEMIMESLERKYPNFHELPDHYQQFYFIRFMLGRDYFDFGSYPKGLLPFHKYKTHPATAFEEHLYEAALYSATDGQARLHFTISEDHADKFAREFEKIENWVEQKTGVKFDISFSYQKESTDTLAVNEHDEPFRIDDGSLLFRPGGHGALIENLNEQQADLIFIKNIDNVVVYKYKHQISDYKKMLAGVLLKIRARIYRYAQLLEETHPDQAKIREIMKFLQTELNVHIKADVEKYKEEYQIEFLKEKLNAPIRVCGMVKNEGEPGGGPFWVKDEDGNISLQIIESAQIDPKNKFQQDIFKSSTHFNPVDLVCCVKDYKGRKFDLRSFVDHRQAFITHKTKEGKEVKALELPGLWNGGMANWITVFVEVPLITFNPVKTVVDLLKPAHQVKGEPK